MNDGGPAFPHEPGALVNDRAGMTLRDYFAAKAMQSQVITDMVPGPACDALIEAAEKKGRSLEFHLALNSYEIADAMLKAREAKP